MHLGKACFHFRPQSRVRKVFRNVWSYVVDRRRLPACTDSLWACVFSLHSLWRISRLPVCLFIKVFFCFFFAQKPSDSCHRERERDASVDVWIINAPNCPFNRLKSHWFDGLATLSIVTLISPARPPVLTAGHYNGSRQNHHQILSADPDGGVTSEPAPPSPTPKHTHTHAPHINLLPLTAAQSVGIWRERRCSGTQSSHLGLLFIISVTDRRRRKRQHSYPVTSPVASDLLSSLFFCLNKSFSSAFAHLHFRGLDNNNNSRVLLVVAG